MKRRGQTVSQRFHKPYTSGFNSHLRYDNDDDGGQIDSATFSHHHHKTHPKLWMIPEIYVFEAGLRWPPEMPTTIEADQLSQVLKKEVDQRWSSPYINNWR